MFSHICCKCMFQMFRLFQTYVASVLFGCCICCNAHTHMLQAYVINVSSISDVCCNKCFTLQVFHQQARLGSVGRGGPLGCSGSCVRVGSQAGATAGAKHKVVSMDMAVAVEHEAVSMLDCSLSLSIFQIDAAGQQQHHTLAAACRQQECPARRGLSLLLLMAAAPQACTVKSRPSGRGTGEGARAGASI
jgi:hypothetical protein